MIYVPSLIWGYRFKSGRTGFIEASCPVSNCFISSDISASDQGEENFDAFIFHAPRDANLDAGEPILVKHRRPDQVFIFFSMEPPNVLEREILKTSRAQNFDGHFNWTISYRSDSDFYLPYGLIEPLASAPSTDADTLRLIESAGRSSNIHPAKGKTKLVLWMVSNCHARSNRQECVRKLQEHIQVDIISKDGRCGGNITCPRVRNEDVCYEMMEKTYKFYLSFENAICREYVSEKFFDIISRNIVPVVLGGTDYSSIAPRHSYIDARQYTPRQLADYLLQIDADDKLYAQFFWWRPFYRVSNLRHTNDQVFCDLCAALHNRSTAMKCQTHFSVWDWYVTDGQCVHRPQF